MKGTMKLVDAHQGLMKCQVCGSESSPDAKPGGGFYRGAWQCQYGCTRADLKAQSQPGASQR